MLSLYRGQEGPRPMQGQSWSDASPTILSQINPFYWRTWIPTRFFYWTTFFTKENYWMNILLKIYFTGSSFYGMKYFTERTILLNKLFYWMIFLMSQYGTPLRTKVISTLKHHFSQNSFYRHWKIHLIGKCFHIERHYVLYVTRPISLWLSVAMIKNIGN